MFARDLMCRRFAYVTPETDLDFVARLLADSDVGVVPVVDDGLALIGVITRSNLERARPAPPVELGPLPAFLLRNRPPAPFRFNGGGVREAMTAPAISVSASDKLVEIAALMQARHLKRAPVVEGEKLVGVLLRREVLNALARGIAPEAPESARASHAPADPTHCDIATAIEFQQLVAAHERRLDAEREARLRTARAFREESIRQLAARRLSEGQWREMIAQARRAAAGGAFEHMLIRFPAQLCSDGGRAINAPDPAWPATLRGEPADVFKRWRSELHPRGFTLAAQIIDFPDGVPGDAALFLTWGRA